MAKGSVIDLKMHTTWHSLKWFYDIIIDYFKNVIELFGNAYGIEELQIYMALGPDSFCEWSVKNHVEELANEDAHKYMAFWYEQAVDEQKKELREHKKRLKAQAVEVPLPIVEDLSSSV